MKRKATQNEVEMIGRRVAILRKRQGLTLQELARRASVNPSYLGQLEEGQALHLSPEILRRLVVALKLLEARGLVNEAVDNMSYEDLKSLFLEAPPKQPEFDF